MSEREDVEALARALCPGQHVITGRHEEDCVGQARGLLASPWLAAHVEAVRVSERVRLAGEVEALRSALDRTEHNFCLAVQGKPVRDMAENLAENEAARVPTAGVRLTEEA